MTSAVQILPAAVAAAPRSGRRARRARSTAHPDRMGLLSWPAWGVVQQRRHGSAHVCRKAVEQPTLGSRAFWCAIGARATTASGSCGVRVRVFFPPMGQWQADSAPRRRTRPDRLCIMGTKSCLHAISIPSPRQLQRLRQGRAWCHNGRVAATARRLPSRMSGGSIVSRVAQAPPSSKFCRRHGHRPRTAPRFHRNAAPSG